MEKNRRKAFLVLAVVLMACFCISACVINVGIKKDPLELAVRGQQPERTPIYEHAGWIIARSSLHNHTTYSDGCRTPEDLLELARMQGMSVLSITDHREGKICAGERGVVCARVGGIEDYGYDVYFNHLKKLAAAAQKQGMILLQGVEVFPWFWNYGKFPALVLDGLQHHFVVYDVYDPKVFENMPARRHITISPEPIPDAAPWQRWVDYMLDHGAIVHAVHVEEGEDMWIGPVHGACPPPIKNLHRLQGLTGFAIFPSGWREKAGGPGGLWDTTLVEYLLGMRDKPMWAHGEADYHCDGSLAWATSLLYMKEFTLAEVKRCLREGRVVSLQGDAFQDTYVAEWWVADSEEPEDLVMLGQEVTLKGAPLVRFALDRPVDGLTIRLVRNGRVIAEVEGSELTYRDQELGLRKEPVYYRVEVSGPRAKWAERSSSEAASSPFTSDAKAMMQEAGEDPQTMAESELRVNPIFVRFEGRKNLLARLAGDFPWLSFLPGTR